VTRPTPAASARSIVAAYEPGFRAALTVPPESADDPAALRVAVDALPDPARALLELLALVVPVGEPVPERLRGVIERDGRPLWSGALLLPRATPGGVDVHPLRYVGACRLNAALRESVFFAAPPPADDPTPAFPPSDARWDAIVVAAVLESAPAQLTAEGTLRRDVERRLFTNLGAGLEVPRWALALQVARLTGLVRPSEGRLRGYPEAVPRPLADPIALFPDALRAATAAALLRILPREPAAWVDVPALLDRLRERCRQLLVSPLEGRYPDAPTRPFDDAGWEQVEAPVLRDVLDVLHRVGVVDAAHTADGVIRVVRRAGPRPTFAPGFLLLPDGDILVHSGELAAPDYGRLARLAPYVDGARMHRHRLSREGAAADLAAGHRDSAAFLTAHSRTGVPPGIAEMLRDWQRAAQRIVVLSGIDVVERDDGTLALAAGPAPAGARVIDYSTPPRARFLYRRGRIAVPDGWDALTVRAAVERVARYVGREGDERVYEPEARSHADAAPLLARLRAYYGGDLPGEIEVLVLSGAALPPVLAAPAAIVRLPAAAASALRRDWIAGPLLRHALSDEESVVAAADLSALRERVVALGLRWSDEG
jgi:hypothetical protein